MDDRITGVMVYYYFVCRRKLWYFCHDIKSINRIRLEFKDALAKAKNYSDTVLIESDWNLKLII